MLYLLRDMHSRPTIYDFNILGDRIQMKPHVLFVLPDLEAGGAHFMNLRLAHALSVRGWHVRVAVLFDRPCAVTLDPPVEISIVFFRAYGLVKKLLLPPRLMALAKTTDAVVGGIEFAPTNYGFIASRLSRRPFLSWTHTDFFQHQEAARSLDRAASRLIYRSCRDVVFPSEGARDSLRKALGGKPRKSRWHVIENFIPIPAPRPFPPKEGFDGIFSRPVVVGIGRLVALKGFDRLIRAHAALRAHGIDHHLLILGEGPARGELQELVRSLQVSSTVFMPGHVPAPISWLQRCHIFALCSHYEGLPLALLEALSCGIPCIAMDCPSGPREILQGGKYGMLTPGDDEAAFQRGIERLFTEPQLHEHFARVGPRRAHDYSPENILPKWEALLTDIIRRKG